MEKKKLHKGGVTKKITIKGITKPQKPSKKPKSPTLGNNK